jgi:hypothetical protein
MAPVALNWTLNDEGVCVDVVTGVPPLVVTVSDSFSLPVPLPVIVPSAAWVALS